MPPGYTVKKPEGNVNALYLLKMVFRRKEFWKQLFTVVEFLEFVYGLLFLQLEGNYVVRLEGSVELGFYYSWIVTIGTACSGSS